jgi:DNA polymerase I
MSRVVFDIEGDGFLFHITRLWCISTWEITEGVKHHFGPDRIDEGIEYLKQAGCLIGHNIIGYDLPAIWKVTGEWEEVPLCLDTLIVSRFLYPERPGGHSLEAWGDKLGYPKQEFSDFSQYTPVMAEYCDNDVAVNVKVLEELEKEHGTTLTGYQVYR